MTNQASEDELDNILRSLAYDAMESGVDNSKHGYIYNDIDELLPTAKAAIKSLVRTEKLKLLDRLSSHQEDLFWWTGGEYEKTKAVDMRAIQAERAKLKEVK